MTQDRNAELVKNLTPDFTRRNEFYQSGARLGDAFMWLNRDAGGALMWGFDGQSIACYGSGSLAQWDDVQLTYSDYFATAHGGPYVDLNGTDEHLEIVDAGWQDSGSRGYLVWFWVLTNDVTSEGTIAAKWDAFVGNERAWRLYLTSNDLFGFQVVPTGGAAGTGLAIESTLVLTAGTWYFVAGYFEPSTLQLVAVGAASDASLTVTSATASVPANIHNSASDLYIGTLMPAGGALANYWDGLVSIGLARANTPSTNIRSHMTRLFQATKWFYQE